VLLWRPAAAALFRLRLGGEGKACVIERIDVYFRVAAFERCKALTGRGDSPRFRICWIDLYIHICISIRPDLMQERLAIGISVFQVDLTAASPSCIRLVTPTGTPSLVGHGGRHEP
jgi:hypothetical protein